MAVTVTVSGLIPNPSGSGSLATPDPTGLPFARMTTEASAAVGVIFKSAVAAGTVAA